MEPIIIHVDPELRELIPDFMKNRHRDVTSLGDALATQDFDALYRLGHTLKGVGGGFGFDGISSIGAAIERAALAKRLDELVQRVEALRSYLENVELVFDPD